MATLLMLALVFVQPASAQEGEPPLTFGLSRDFGYALGSTIQGTFSVRVQDDGNLVQIALLIDGQQISADDEPPFRIRFSTSDFAAGIHTIEVVGITADEEQLASQPIEVEFLSNEQARSQAIEVVFPLLALLFVLMVLGTLGPEMLGRGKRSFQLGAYGSAGGAVCPKCDLPFGRHNLSANLLVGKIERCPHCGKWGVVRRASSSALEAAESKYTANMSEGLIQKEDDAAHLRRMIDESRYESSE